MYRHPASDIYICELFENLAAADMEIKMVNAKFSACGEKRYDE